MISISWAHFMILLRWVSVIVCIDPHLARSTSSWPQYVVVINQGCFHLGSEIKLALCKDNGTLIAD